MECSIGLSGVFFPPGAYRIRMSTAWTLETVEWMGVDSEPIRLRQGDPEAFDALLARYQNRLFRYLMRLTANPAVAQDLFQETWLRVITRIHRYDERRPFEPWLFAVARNLAIDHLRKASPESLDEPSESGEAKISRLDSDEPGSLERLLERERRALLERRLEELPALYREALSLRFEEEMTFEEMAAVLSAPLSTVKSRVHRALSLLRRRMRAGQ
jgi:RNA polymerase sigma-70 factor (ECF subfamily)